MGYPGSFLTDLYQRIRDYADEPVDNAKWTDAKLYQFVRGSWARIMHDVNACGDAPLVVRYDLVVNNSDQVYYLPPNIGQILRFGRVYQDGSIYDAIVPRSRLNPVGPGIIFEGLNRVRFEPKWGINETLRIEYIPSGDLAVHEGTVANTAVTSTTVTLDTTPTVGYFDQRPNAYLGSVLRYLSGASPSGYSFFPVQERVITEQTISSTNPVVTVDSAFSPDPSVASGTLTYEIVPFLGWQLIEPLAWNVAMSLHATMAGDPSRTKKLQAAQLMYNNQMRMIRGSLSHYNARSGGKFNGDVPGNSRWTWSLGMV